jgi:uncharacterized membrane-anchored protein
VTRWVEPPAYQAETHRLVWSAEVRRKNDEDANPAVNYNTFVLGREGYISLDLVTALTAIQDGKSAAHTLLDTVSFKEDKRYADFTPSTDKVAAYGVAALAAGVAAIKLGLLAIIGAFAVKFAKLIFIAIAAFGAGIARWFKGQSAGKNSQV